MGAPVPRVAAAVIALLLAASALVAQPDPIPSTLSERVIDVEAAQHAKKIEHSFRPWQAPLLPFLVFGRVMEKGFIAVDRNHLLEKAQYYMAEHDRGFKPLFGGLGIGTGFALGVEYYRNDFLRRGGRIGIPLRASTLLYQDYGVDLSLPADSSQRVSLDANAHYRVRSQDDFFGLGNGSRAGDRTSYMLQSRQFSFGPRFELTRRLHFNARFGYNSTSVFDGKDARFPVITARFARSQVPGLRNGARLWAGEVSLVHDTRDVPGRPRSGGYHRLEAGWRQSGDSNDFGFWRYRVEAERYLPLGSRNRVLALRFLGITNQARGGSAVPFFEQVILGGSSTLRGFREFRFYDTSGVMMSAEYRYNLNAYADMVLFVDQGQVARQPGDFSWSGLRTGYGGGLRFLNQSGTPFKILLGRSNEGTRIYFSLGGTF
jgi:outer membrane protein assembly factor BamA